MLVQSSHQTRLFCLFYEVFKVHEVGGDEENRTPDPLLARQVLSQLSYGPIDYLRVEPSKPNIVLTDVRRLRI